jgi:hypothetical protein
MNSTSANSLLNDLLVEIHRSLVQYAAEAWPWSTGGAGELQAAILSLAERQRQDAGRIVHLLKERGEVIDFGMFPHAYTSLHYVALEYLAAMFLEGQRGLVRLLDDSVSRFHGDPEAQRLVSQIAISQREGLQRLLSAEIPGGAAASAWMK